MKTQLRESAAANARLEAEKAALQAALTTQEQRLLAQADQERAAWQQEEARLHRVHEALVDRVRALVLPS